MKSEELIKVSLMKKKKLKRNDFEIFLEWQKVYIHTVKLFMAIQHSFTCIQSRTIIPARDFCFSTMFRARIFLFLALQSIFIA